MKILKKISLVYALQISAVVFIFGYPECVSSIKRTGDKTSLIPDIRQNTGVVISEAGTQRFSDSVMISKGLQPVVTNFISLLHAGK